MPLKIGQYLIVCASAELDNEGNLVLTYTDEVGNVIKDKYIYSSSETE